jgi:pimeloyl-ACP methyl ester carboxylesterase
VTEVAAPWRDLLLPFAAGEVVDLGAARLWFHDDGGDGPALLLMGGFSPGHHHFSFVRPHLRGFRLLTWEPRGFGPSTGAGDESYDAASWARDLHDLLRARDVPRVHLWANGFSSYIALAFAARHPEMVDRLITYTDVWAGDPAKGYDKVWKVYAAVIEAFGCEGPGAQLLARLYGVDDPAWFTAWFADAVAEVMRPETALPTLRYCMLEADIRADLLHIEAPTLVVLGEEAWEGQERGDGDDPSLAAMRSAMRHVEVSVVSGAHPIHGIVQAPAASASEAARFLRGEPAR